MSSNNQQAMVETAPGGFKARARRWAARLALLAGVFVVLPLALIYAWMAFAPTRFDAMAREGSPAMKRLDKMLTPPPPAIPLPRRAPDADRATSATTSLAPKKDVLIDSIVHAKANYAGAEADRLLPPVRLVLRLQTRPVGEGYRWTFEQGNAPKHAKPDPLEALSKPFPSDALSGATTTESRALDQTEAVLASPLTGTKASYDAFAAIQTTDRTRFMLNAQAATVRAARQGRSRDAQALTLRCLDLGGVIDAGAFPLGSGRFNHGNSDIEGGEPDSARRAGDRAIASNIVNAWIPMLAALARSGAATDAFWAQADARLAALRWTPEQVRDLRLAHARRWLASLDEALVPTGPPPGDTGGRSALERAYIGAKQGVAKIALLPMARNRAKDVAWRYANGDLGPLLGGDDVAMLKLVPHVLFSRLTAYCAARTEDEKYEDYHLFDREYLFDLAEFQRGLRDVTIDLARVALAMERHRQKTGQYAESIAELGLAGLTPLPASAIEVDGLPLAFRERSGLDPAARAQWRAGNLAAPGQPPMPYAGLEIGPFDFEKEYKAYLIKDQLEAWPKAWAWPYAWFTTINAGASVEPAPASAPQGRRWHALIAVAWPGAAEATQATH